MLLLRDLKLSFGQKLLFEKVNLQLYKNQVVGLVGQNGAGKTSLFKLILNQLFADSGDILLSKDIDIGYVEQEFVDLEQNIVQYILATHPLIINYEVDLPEYYSLQPKVEKLLINLGFNQNDLDKPLKSFSGGWQMRVNLAKALFKPSDLLLLDEPTNHLDVETVIWLEDWIKNYNGLAIIISHDREFLDNVTTNIVAIQNQRVILYGGNYSTYEITRLMKLEQDNKIKQKNDEKIMHLQNFVDRFKAKASLAKQAKSKMKMIEKLKITESLPKDIEYEINFLEPEYQASKLVSIDNADFGYENNILLKNVKLDIFNNSRIGLLGRNGVGKSTFIRGIIDKVTLLNGVVESNNKVKIGYFAQNTIDYIDINLSPLQLFKNEHSNKKDSELRAYLGSYGFTGDKVTQCIKNFSGGEKARLVIANIILHRPNLLFLDEPTNHLDMQMREELAASIQDFNGGVVIVSHDKFLLQSIVEDYYIIQNNSLDCFKGDLEDYHQYLLQLNINSMKKDSKFDVKNNVNKGNKRLVSDIEKLEIDIRRFEKEKRDIESKIIKEVDDQILLERYALIKQKISDKENLWYNLQEQLQNVEKY
jgi:ATP-binding cassette subfamily F protein 3